MEAQHNILSTHRLFQFVNVRKAQITGFPFAVVNSTISSLVVVGASVAFCWKQLHCSNMNMRLPLKTMYDDTLFSLQRWLDR